VARGVIAPWTTGTIWEDKTMLRNFLKEEQGQSTVEYLLIIAVIVVVITTFGSRAQKGMEELTNTVFGELNKSVRGIFSKAQMR
jgi:Flp pilus assembly pilin Flp